VGLYSVLILVVDRADGQIAFELFEDGFDLDQLQVLFPELGRRFFGHVGAQQVAAFPPPGLTDFVQAQLEGEGLVRGGQLDLGQAPGRIQGQPIPWFVFRSYSRVFDDQMIALLDCCSS
jgi:hypothetical protein